MLRSYAPSNIVQLPRLGVSDAIALGASLSTRAQAVDALPPPIANAFTRMDDSLEDLRVAAQVRVVGEESGTAQEADRVLDATWSAANQWCLGWCRLPPLPRHVATLQMATTLRDRLFADGVKFTMLRFRTQWVESQTRLDIIEDEDLAPLFAQLGGASILEALHEAQDAYGKALGITAVGDGDAPAATLRELLIAFQDALRRYVIQVSAHADQDDVAAQDLAESLLAPLMVWRSTPATSVPEEDEGSAGGGDTDGSGNTDGSTPATSSTASPAASSSVASTVASGAASAASPTAAISTAPTTADAPAPAV